LKVVADQTPFTNGDENALGPLYQHNLSGDNKGDNPDATNEDREVNPLDEPIVLYINDNNLAYCPQVEISFGELKITAVVDSGSQVCVLAESLYEQLVAAGLQALTLPLENVTLITAFGNRTRRIKFQAYLEFCIGNDRFESVFLISPQLTGSEAILGCNYAHEYGIVIDFMKNCLYYERDGIRRMQMFCQSRDIKDAGGNEMESCGQSAHSIDSGVQTRCLTAKTGMLPIQSAEVRPSCKVLIKTPVFNRTLVRVHKGGEPLGFCGGEVNKKVRQSSLQFNDARCGQYDGCNATEIGEVNGINRNEAYSSCVEGLCVGDVEKDNGQGNYDKLESDRRKVISSDENVEGVSDPRSLRICML
jgi:hypothetical protein